jgi:hypothetical protein
MPLERGRIIGYDASRMAFEFTMIDRADVVIIECEISSAAMDQLAGTKSRRDDPHFLIITSDDAKSSATFGGLRRHPRSRAAARPSRLDGGTTVADSPRLSA